MVEAENRKQDGQDDQQHHAAHQHQHGGLEQAHHQGDTRGQAAFLLLGGAGQHPVELTGAFAAGDHVQHHRRNVAAEFQATGQGSPFADRAGDIGHTRANGQVAYHGGGDLQRVYQRHRTFAEDRQGAGETCGFHRPQHFTKDRHIEHQTMPTQPPDRLTQTPAPKANHHRQRAEQQQTMVAQAVTGADQRPGQPRQWLAAVDENFHHVRHHVTEQKTDDHHAGQHQDQRIHQGHLDLLP
ncbi:hypothetical protein D3C73_608990 [compost metagenome]